MGHDRAGWYSWDRLDNVGRRSALDLAPRMATSTARRPAGRDPGWQPVVADRGMRPAPVPGTADVAGSSRAPVRPGRSSTGALRRLDLELPAHRASRRPDPAGGQRLLGATPPMAPRAAERPGARALALGHADPAVRWPATPSPRPPAVPDARDFAPAGGGRPWLDALPSGLPVVGSPTPQARSIVVGPRRSPGLAGRGPLTPSHHSPASSRAQHDSGRREVR